MTEENFKTIEEIIKIFGIDSITGYLRVIIIGIGRRLGIFEYLHQKLASSNEKNKFESVVFTISELERNLQLNERYLDAWLNAALELGIFDIYDRKEKKIKNSTIHL